LATVTATGIVTKILASLPAGMVTVAAAILLRQTERGFLGPRQFVSLDTQSNQTEKCLINERALN
jgi:hypothetical protein